ncbi:MAG: hypothetical protein AAFY59_18830 [Pseudomonadota bacterium]
MTTVISRLYESAETAHAVAAELKAAGLAANTIDVITQSGEESAAERIAAARVPSGAAETYAQMLSAERALLVCRAPFQPQGIAIKAMNIVDAHDPVTSGVANENHYVREKPKRFYTLSVFTDHRRMFSGDLKPGYSRRTLGFSRTFGIPLLARKRNNNSVYKGGEYMSQRFLPIPLTSNKPRVNSAKNTGLTFKSFFGLRPLTQR